MTFLDRLKPHVDISDRFKSQAWETLEKMGLPTKKWDAFRYISLQKLYQQVFSLKEEGFSISEEGGIVILPLGEALRSYRPLLDKSFHEGIQEEKNPFVLLNRALYQGGTFLYLPPGKRIDLHWNFPELKEGEMSLPKFEIFVGKGAELTIHAKYHGKGAYFCNEQIQITLDEGSKGALHLHTNHSGEGYGMHTIRARVKRDATFQTFTFTKGGKGERHDVGVDLLGENSEAEVKGLSLVKGGNEVHHYVQMKHHAPHCRSNQLFKTVLMGRARSSFEGKIFIDECAQKTESYQLSNNLLLSPKAQAMVKPNLEIYADDVAASHGATCAQPKKEELFYLMTRGLSEMEAKWHLARGFCHELMKGEEVDQFLKEDESDESL